MVKYNKPAADVAAFANVRSISELPQTDTKQILNQTVADLAVADAIVHQIHWYMRGRGFMTLHPKMDEYMAAIDGFYDQFAERLITIGGAPYSTLEEFAAHTNLKEVKGSFDHTMDDNLARLVSVYRYLSDLMQKGLSITDADNDDVTNDIFTAAKTEFDKTIWMVQAELGQAPNL